jgi:hypothetical protein
MTDKVLIPAGIVDLVREGLRSQLAIAARQLTDVDGLSSTREHPERYTDPLLCLDALRAVMQEIGANRVDPQDDLQLDPQAHGWALAKLLADEVSSHKDMLRDRDLDDERRRELSREMNALIAIALELLLRIQAMLLHPAGPKNGCQGGAYAGFL